MTKVDQTGLSNSKIIGNNGTKIKPVVTKVKTLTFQENSSIKFDLQENTVFAISAQTIEFKLSRGKSSKITFGWDFDTQPALDIRLKGRKGKNGNDGKGNGGNGESGRKGERGGTRHSPTIFLFVGDIVVSGGGKLDDVSIEFDLDGIIGGVGGEGGNGGNGQEGKKGRDSLSDVFCIRSASNGHNGGHGGYGGQGGDGGCGGDGATIHVYCVKPEHIEFFENSNFKVGGGQGGPPGSPGLPGVGGPGGKKGKNKGSCRGRRRNGFQGQPRNQQEKDKWHLGAGTKGLNGKDGDFLLNILQNTNILD